MFVTYIVVTILAAAARDFLGHARFHPLRADSHQHDESRRVGIVDKHTGNFKSSRRARIAHGIGVPAVGIAAAAGLVLFFIGAIITHLRGQDYSFGLAIVFLFLAIAALGVRLVTS